MNLFFYLMVVSHFYNSYKDNYSNNVAVGKNKKVVTRCALDFIIRKKKTVTYVYICIVYRMFHRKGHINQCHVNIITTSSGFVACLTKLFSFKYATSLFLH